MTASTQYHLRAADGAIQPTGRIDEAFTQWQGDRERWLFLGPHDDDICFGAGLTLAVGVDANVEVHAVVTTDGRMGYCDLEERSTIARIRRIETIASCALLGVPEERIHFLGFADGDLMNAAGRRPAGPDDPTAMAGYTGLQNAFTRLLRKVRPTRLFLPTGADLHPDHKIAHQEMLISIFHAQGAIWPELGAPLEAVPQVYEFAVYCDYPGLPTLKVTGTDSQFQKKLAGAAAFASQRQVAAMVEAIRSNGPVEYLRETPFRLYSPATYTALFEA